MCTTCGCGTGDDVDVLAHGHGHDHHHHHHDHHDHGHHEHEHEHGHDHDRATRTVRFERELLAKNQRLAEQNRRALADARISVFNLIGSPGAGKTALLEATIARLRDHVSLSVLEGDQATDRDARRIEKAGGRVLQINTDAGCHLDASMIAEGLRVVGPARSSVVFVENVGNLVCPALFDLGERAKVVVMSVTEGEDKPLKYPHVFRAASLFVLTKTDLLPHLDVDVDRCVAYAREINPKLDVVRVSALRGDGLDAWCDYVRREAP